MPRHLVLLLLLINGITVNAGFYDMHEPYILRKYHSYADVYFNEFSIPDSVLLANFEFIILPKGEDCPGKTATVYLQNGGLPVFTPLNETFPDGFSGHESYVVKTILNSSRLSYDHLANIQLVSPPAGRWFAASHLDPDNATKQIKPAAFTGKTCQYFVKVSAYYTRRAYDQDKMFHVNQKQEIITEDRYTYIRYFIDEKIHKYTISVENCMMLFPNQLDGCSFAIASSGPRIPTAYSPKAMCVWNGPDNNTDCSVEFYSPDVDKWHYARIVTANITNIYNITLKISTEKCDRATNSAVQILGFGPANCLVEDYYTDTIPGVPYTASFRRVTDNHISLFGPQVFIGSFHIRSLVHSGGTMKYNVSVPAATVIPTQSSRYVPATIYSCLTQNSFTINRTDIKKCSDQLNLTMPYQHSVQSSHFVPYPREGVWYLSVIAECHNGTVESQCPYIVELNHNVTLSPCVDRGCGEYGRCLMYYSGIIHWSTCKCKVGYRGYGCTDGTVAESDGMQLLATLLLTLSNILFAVAGVWAIYKKWFSEALVYFFVLFSSTFYHACDNGTIYTLCIAKYSMLQYCDFYGAILAVWLTIMAMSDLSAKLRSFLHMAGVLGIIVGTQISLVGLWNFVIPVLIAAVILATSWVRMCKLKGACFPGRRVWLIQILPGIICALVGLAMYSLLETDENYFYIHSIWHLLIASAVIFMLPRDNQLELAKVKVWFCKIRVPGKRRNELSDETSAISECNGEALIETPSGTSSPGTTCESVDKIICD